MKGLWVITCFIAGIPATTLPDVGNLREFSRLHSGWIDYHYGSLVQQQSVWGTMMMVFERPRKQMPLLALSGHGNDAV